MKRLCIFLLILCVEAIQQGRRRRRSNPVKCSPGKFRNNRVCIDCPNHTYRPDTDHIQSSCIPCEAGRNTTHIASTYCIGDICEAGKYGTIGSTICKICKSGEYSDVGSFECKKCKSGQHNPSSNQATCLGTPCPAGYSGPTGLTSLHSRSCSICVSGKYSDKGSETCKDCPMETYSYDGSDKCINHQKCGSRYYTYNYYNDKQKTCKKCYLASNLHQFAFIFSVSSTIFFLIFSCCNCPKYGYTFLFILPGIIFSCIIGVCSNIPASNKKIYCSFGVLGGLLLFIIGRLIYDNKDNFKHIWINCIPDMRNSITVQLANIAQRREQPEQPAQIVPVTNNMKI